MLHPAGLGEAAFTACARTTVLGYSMVWDTPQCWDARWHRGAPGGKADGTGGMPRGEISVSQGCDRDNLSAEFGWCFSLISPPNFF